MFRNQLKLTTLPEKIRFLSNLKEFYLQGSNFFFEKEKEKVQKLLLKCEFILRGFQNQLEIQEFYLDFCINSLIKKPVSKPQKKSRQDFLQNADSI